MDKFILYKQVSREWIWRKALVICGFFPLTFRILRKIGLDSFRNGRDSIRDSI